MEQEFLQRKGRIRRSCLTLTAAGILLILLCALTAYFYGAPAYAASQIAQARRGGVFASPEEAFTARVYVPGSIFQGARAASLTNVQCGPNSRTGSLPFLWFCTGSLLYDRTPQGQTSAETFPGMYVMQVQGGWVVMQEGAFPELVGRIMEKYHLEELP